MKVIAETERLFLREFETSDAKYFYCLNSDAEVLKYTGDIPFSSIKEAELFLKNYSEYESNGFGRWAVISKKSATFIGWCGLKLNEENMIDLGFRFFRKEWNKGYATESSRAALNYGFNILNIDEIIGTSWIDSHASIRFLKKIGVKFLEKDSCLEMNNTVYYKIKKIEFNKMKNS